MSREEQGARFSPQPTRNKSCCSVMGCHSKACRDITVRFHSFPKPGADLVKLPNRLGVLAKMSRRDAWKRRLMMTNKTITESTRVCSLHFRRSDYILPDAPTQKRYLKRDALPSCNLPQSGNSTDLEMEMGSEDYGYLEVNAESYGVRDNDAYSVDGCWNTKIKEESTESETRLEPQNEKMEFQDYTDDRESLPNVKTGLADSTIKEEPEEIDIKFESVDFPDAVPTSGFRRKSSEKSSNLRNATTQTDDRPRGLKFRMRTSIGDLNVLTGIPNFGVLRRLVDVVKIASPRLARARGLRLDAEDRIVMTLMKLKQDLTYGALSALFGCKSPKSCKRIILRTLKTLSRCLRFAIRWPGWNWTGAKTLPDLPDDLSNARCIISRIEVDIKRPREVVKRLMTFSSCSKRRHSAKFMTAVTTDGFICFLSRAYGGRTVHRTLFEESNVLKFLEANDVLVAFKDFPIEDICQRHGVKLVKSLYSRKEEETRRPGSYRQRLNVNRRIRRFRIFRRKLPNTLATRVEQILTILCAVENLAYLESGGDAK